MFKYSMQLFWSDTDGEYVALIPEFPHLSALAETPERAAHEAEVVVGLVLDHMAEVGEEPPEPQVLSSYSGEIRVRMPRTLHQKLAGRARMEKVSLNTLMVSLLAEGIGAASTEVSTNDSVGRCDSQAVQPSVKLPTSGGDGLKPGVDLDSDAALLGVMAEDSARSFAETGP